MGQPQDINHCCEDELLLLVILFKRFVLGHAVEENRLLGNKGFLVENTFFFGEQFDSGLNLLILCLFCIILCYSIIKIFKRSIIRVWTTFWRSCQDFKAFLIGFYRRFRGIEGARFVEQLIRRIFVSLDSSFKQNLIGFRQGSITRVVRISKFVQNTKYMYTYFGKYRRDILVS